MLLILASKSLVKKCLPLMHTSLAPQASLANQALQVRPEGCECARTKNVNFSLPVWSDFICFTFWLIYYVCICAKFKKKKLYGCYGQPLPIVWHHPLWIHVFLGMQAVFVLNVLNFSVSLGCLTCFTCHFLYFNPVLKHPLFHFRNIYCFSSLSVCRSLCQLFYFSLPDLQGFICWFYVIFQIQRNMKRKL